MLKGPAWSVGETEEEDEDGKRKDELGCSFVGV